MDARSAAWVLFEVLVLLAAVALLDVWWIRTGLTFALAMLLAQPALRAEAELSPVDGGTSDVPDRRSHHSLRGDVESLLQCIRRFHYTCHLVRSSQIAPEDSDKRIKDIEKEVNKILADVIDSSKVPASQ